MGRRRRPDRTCLRYDDTKRYIDASSLSAADKAKIFSGNAQRVYSRLKLKAERYGTWPGTSLAAVGRCS